MSEFRVDDVLNEVSNKVDAHQLALLLDYHPEKIQIDSDQVKGFCPLHREQAFRSLVLDNKAKTFRCTMKRCVGFEGGSFADLWAFHRDLEGLDAALDLADQLKLDIDVEGLRDFGSGVLEKAREALAAKNLEEARKAIDKALAFLPRDPEAGRMSAEIYQALGESDSAINEFLRVIDICIEEQDFTNARSMLSPLLESHEGSIEPMLRLVALAKAEKDAPKIVKALLDLAILYSDAADVDQELHMIGEIEKIGEASPEVWEQIASLHEKAGRSNEQIDVLHRLSGVYEQVQDWQKLCQCLERREAHEPENRELQEQIAEALIHLNELGRATQRFLGLARFHRNHGDEEEAQRLLHRLLEIEPDNLEALEQFAASNAECGKTEEAIELYRKLAAHARRQGDGEAATRYLEVARGIDPDNHTLRYDLAQSQLEQNDLESGIGELFELADFFLVEPDPAKGFEILEKIDGLAPEDAAIQERIGACLESAGFDAEAVAAYLRFADRMYDNKNFSEAEKVCSQASTLEPGNEEILDRRIKCLLAQKDKTGAIAACREIAKSLLGNGDHEACERVLAKGTKIDRTDPELNSDVARLFEVTGRVAEAVARLLEVSEFHRAAGDAEASLQAAREAARIDPQCVEAQGIVAEHLEAQGQVAAALDLRKAQVEILLGQDPESKEALQILDHIVEIAPTDLETWGKYAHLKHSLLGSNEAESAFESWLKLSVSSGGISEQIEAYGCAVANYPEAWTWLAKLADLLIERGPVEEALPHLEKLLDVYRSRSRSGSHYLSTLERCVDIFPQRTDLRLEWAEALAGVGGLDHSRAIFTEVARQHLAEGDQKGGLEVLLKSLQYQPENRELLAQIAKLYEEMGNREKAVESYERLARLNREQEDRAANISVLTSLAKLSPDRIDLRTELAENYEKNGEIDKAVDQYHAIAQMSVEKAPTDDDTLSICNKLSSLAPDFEPASELLIRCFLSRKDTESAKAELEKLGDRALEDGVIENAERAFKRIQEIDPNDIGSGERLGKLYEASGQTERAAEAYRSVLDIYSQRDDHPRALSVLKKLKTLSPTDLQLRLELARTLGRMDESNEQICAEWLELITMTVEQGMSEESDAAMSEAAPYFAEQFEARFNLLRIYTPCKKDEEAAELWKALALESLEAKERKITRNATSEGLVVMPSNVELREIRIRASKHLKESVIAQTDLRILADQSMNNGRFGPAESYLAQAIELTPDDDELIGLLAECQVEQGHLEDAVKTLRHLAEHHRAAGDIERAIERAQECCEHKPDDLASKNFYAQVLIEGGREDEALEIWREIGEGLLAAGNQAAALEQFRQIAIHRDRDVPCLRSVADLRLEVEGEDAAIESYLQLLDVMCEDSPAEETEAEFRRILQAGPERLQIAERYALYLHTQGRSADAEKELLRICRAHRESNSDTAGALRTIQLLESIDPGNLAALAEEASIREEIGETVEAGELLAQLAEAFTNKGSDEESAQVLSRRASLLREDPNAQVAAAEAFEELDDAQSATKFYMQAIAVLDAKKELEPCIPLLQKAIALNPEKMQLGEALGKVYDQTGAIEQAIAHWLDLGERYVQSGDADRAKKVYQHIKSIDRENLESRYRLTAMAEEAGDSAAALSELREILPIAEEQGDDAELVIILRRMIANDPSDAVAMTQLCDVQRRSGDDEELYASLLQLQNLYEKTENLGEALKILGELKGLRPDDMELVSRTIELHIRNGELDEAAKLGAELLRTHLEVGEMELAEAAAQQVTAIDPQNVDRRWQVICIADELGENEFALRHFEKSHEELWSLEFGEQALALCELCANKFSEDISVRKLLIKSLTRLRQDDRAIDEQLHLVDIFVERDQDEAAVEVLDQILTRRPDHESAHEAMVTLSLKTGDQEKTTEFLMRIAEIQYANNRIEDSIRSIERLLEIDPSKTSLQSRLAELYHESGNDERAREVWMESADAYESASDVPRAMEIYEHIRDIFGADISLSEKLIRCYEQNGSDDNYLECGLDLGRAYSEDGQLLKSISIYERLCAHFPTRIETLELLSEAYAKNGNDSECGESLKRLFELHESARQFDRAKECLEKALAYCELDTSTLRKLGQTCLQLKQKPEGVKHLSQAAQMLYQESQWAEAKEVSEAILKADPSNLAIRQLLGILCEEMGDSAAAIKNLTLAARNAAKVHDDAKALELFEKLLEIDASLVNEREAYTKILERLDRTGDACSQYLILIENLGGDGDTKQRIRYCRQVLKLSPDHPVAHEHLYDVYEQTGKTRLALTECRWLADHLLQSGDLDRARNVIERGLAFAPQDLELLKSLIDLLIKSDEMTEAIRRLEELATASQAAGDGATAGWALARACEIDPASLEHRDQLAAHQETTGNVTEARQTRIEIISLHLERAEMEEARLLGEKIADSAAEDDSVRTKIAELFESSGLPEVAAFHYTTLAKSAAAAGNHKQVLELAARVLKSKPRHLPARELRVDALVALEDIGGAWKEACELYNQQMDYGENEAAEKTIKFLIRQRPSSPEPRQWLVDLYRSLGREEPMIDQLRRLAEIYVTQGEVGSAIGNFKELIDKRPDDISARRRYIDLYTQLHDESQLFDDYLALADAHQRNGEFPEATELYESLIRDHPNRREAREQYIEFLFDQGETEKGVEQARELANSYLQSSRQIEASEILDKALLKAPGDVELRHQLAFLQIRTNRRGQALETLRGLVRHFELAGEDERQMQVLEEMLDLDNTDVELNQKLADLYTKLGKGEEAAVRRRILADLYIGRDLYDLAERELRRGIDLNPDDIEAWKKLIETHTKIGSLSESVPDLLVLASLYVKHEQLGEAVETYRKILEVETDNLEVLTNYIAIASQIGSEEDLVDDYLHLATLLGQNGNIRDAMKIYYRLQEIAPDDGRITRGLQDTGALSQVKVPHSTELSAGKAEAHLAEFIEEKETDKPVSGSQLKKAITNYKNILKLNPQNPGVQAKLAQLLVRSGDTEKADEHWRLAAQHFFDRGELERSIEIYEDLMERHPEDAHLRERLSRAVIQCDSFKALESVVREPEDET